MTNNCKQLKTKNVNLFYVIYIKTKKRLGFVKVKQNVRYLLVHQSCQARSYNL